MIHVILGPQGAGKSTLANKICNKHNAVCFSIDEYMSRLFLADIPVPLDLEWIMERVKRCEELIWKTVTDLERAGATSVLDLGLMKVSDRNRIKKLIYFHGYEHLFHFINAPLVQRKARVMSRSVKGGSGFSFEITSDMFDYMELQFEPLSKEELLEVKVY